ncbi:MAG TPA: aminopeptidase N [Pseudolysinimonas sp.]
MPGENLTRLEAQERKAILAVDSYVVDLDLTTGPETFRSTSTVAFTAQGGTTTFLDAITDKVHSVAVNGTPVDPDSVSDGIRIRLEGLVEHNTVTVVADFAYSNTGEGLHRFVDPVDGEVYLYSQFEVPDSRRMYAVFEQPDLKATFQFTVTAPAGWAVISNSPTPTPTQKSDGVATWAFEPTPRISSYITALIAGPYQAVHSELTSSSGRVIPLGIFARKSLFGYLDSDYVFDITRKGFAYYEEKFGYPYPFAKYDQLFVPEFNAGAMENAGAVTFVETYVFRSKVTDAIKERRVVTILHELAHMWFGDLVTMKWWNDLWLNESFAEWASTIASAEATEWTEAWTTFNAMEKSWAYRQDQLPSTHPIVATINDLEDVQVNFDGITYAKGGSVLKQLAAWVGIDEFFAGVGNYFQKYEYGNTELKDLLAELELASGRDLSGWAAQWLETAGVVTLRPELETDESGAITSFRIAQTAAPDYPTLRPHRLAIGFYSPADGGTALVRTHRVELDIDADESTEVPEVVGMARPSLILLNDDDLTYAKIRLDAGSLSVALSQLSDLESPLARALVWGALWDMTRDAEVAPRDYVRLVLDHIASESESTTIRLTLTQLLQTVRVYVAPETRAASLQEVGDRLWKLAQAADGGTDAQFQFVKFFATAASTPAHADALAGLLDGSITLAGLEIDSDLSWELLEGLVLVGTAGETEIAAALEKDNTAKGQQAAALASAAIPTVAGKTAALEKARDDTKISNLYLRNVGIGYGLVNDQSVLEAVVAPYFAALTTVWKNRTYQIAETFAEYFYPAALASQTLVDATKAWLDANPGIPALRRIVIEGLAGVERALAAQARDAKG